MSLPPLFPDPEELVLDSVMVHTDVITIHAATQRTAVPCPSCDTLTDRVHSHYWRTLHDLPWQGTPVRIRLRTRRFFCEVETCPRRIFTERLPQTTASYARSTLRFSSALRAIALALGGEGGRHLSHSLAMQASGDTLLRRLRHAAHAPRPITSPRVLGVDEWAWKKGHRYGTILVDFERRAVVDLLPDRSADSFANWLRDRPSVEVISRDRSSIYAEGAAQGAPNAVQVADRWHLLRNLTDAVERILESRATLLREAATSKVVASPDERAPVDLPPMLSLSRAEQAKETRHAQRLARYHEAVDRRQRGQSLRAVAREMGVNVRTIRRWLRADGFPERKQGPARASKLDAYRSYLDLRFQQGCMNAAQLWRELRDQGFQGGVSIVRAYVGSLRSGLPGPTNWSKKKPTLRQTAWLLVLSETEMKMEERVYVEALTGLSSELARLRELVQAFRRMLREHDVSAFEAWIESAEASLLQRFVASLRTDLAAVRAAVELPWSNGQTEGQVNRLKLIKRSMYGRAGFDLLRERVLYAA